MAPGKMEEARSGEKGQPKMRVVATAAAADAAADAAAATAATAAAAAGLQLTSHGQPQHYYGRLQQCFTRWATTPRARIQFSNKFLNSMPPLVPFLRF